MINFLAAHWGDLLVLTALGLAVGLIIGHMRQKKQSCCGSCGSCGQCGACHMDKK